MTLVLSREVRAGHEQAFAAVQHRLAAEVRREPGHLDVTVLAPQPGGPRICTIVSHFATRADAGAWLSSEARAWLVAEAGRIDDTIVFTHEATADSLAWLECRHQIPSVVDSPDPVT